MDLKLNQALRLAQKKLKDGSLYAAKCMYKDILKRFPKNKKAIEGLKLVYLKKISETKTNKNPPANDLQILIDLYGKGSFEKALEKTEFLSKKFPQSPVVLNIHGAVLQSLKRFDRSIDVFKEAIFIKPDFAEAYNNMGLSLTSQYKIIEAEEVFKKALAVNPDFAEAYNNMGIVLKEQGKMKEATDAYRKALFIKPDFVSVFKNLGLALTEQGKIEEAKEVYKKALAIKPDFAEVHRYLSALTNYKADDPQYIQVKKLYGTKELNDKERCNISFALFKMCEDFGEFSNAFDFLMKGNALRKKLLKYSIQKDKNFFLQLKKEQPKLLANSGKLKKSCNTIIPVFILGMPRSGTTLVEQIISSHSQVTGAGELNYVKQFGTKLVDGSSLISPSLISEFREQYLKEIKRLSNGVSIVTDKMPQNFLFIPLICAAFPESKIIHVQRNPVATCWSNYTQYFVNNDLGYSYDLIDVVEYFKLYKDLMKFWQISYGDQIYNLEYEKLTVDQENETRSLIRYLELDWEQACLAPHDNKRGVKTASKLQVRKKIYQGSSETWRKYELFLDGAFDSLQC